MGQSHTLFSYCPSFFLNFLISSITLLSTSNLACPPRTSTSTWAYTSAATSAKPGPPSPSRNLAASSTGDRSRIGIIYPLQPRSKRLDVCIEVEATLPEPAALLRPDLQQQPTREAPTSLSRPSRRHCRKQRRNRSTALYRPAKRSPPRRHWCEI